MTRSSTPTPPSRRSCSRRPRRSIRWRVWTQAKAKLRSIHERWEAAGKVPRERIREFDSRLKVIEDRIKSAEDRHWRRTDPETEARVAQFRARVDTYRSQAEKARAAGDERKAKAAEAQAQQWEEWLRTAQSAVER